MEKNSRVVSFFFNHKSAAVNILDLYTSLGLIIKNGKTKRQTTFIRRTSYKKRTYSHVID